MSDPIKILLIPPPAIKVNVIPPTAIKLIKVGSVINNYNGGYVFTKTLSGFSVSVLQSEHGVANVRGLRVCQPNGELVEVLETYNGNDIQIDSNILLDDHILTIF